MGSVRIGVALSDPTGSFAQPFEVVHRRKVDACIRIAELVRDYEVATIVMGRPLQLNGRAGLAVDAVESFAASLCIHVQVPLVWWDERLTTAAAERAMIEGGVRRQARRQSIDKVAAALILQGYLDAQPAMRHE